ncbi:MAG: cytochrome c biogenesis protein [Planctomycetes bacterium]|nr:cytochrome c biogenesis protein [Planctomycetota bacterium]
MLLQTFHEFSQNTMSPVATIALHASIAGFFVSSIIALGALLQPARVKMAWADITGAFATGALIAYFVVRFTEVGTEPLQNMFEVVALSALLVALAYFVATRLRKLPSFGAFAYPAVTIIFLVDLMLAGTAMGDTEAPISSPLLVMHIVLTILAYGVFFMATVAAVMFLLQERMLKKHKDPAILRSLPPLESLRRLVNSCILIGLPVLTAGFALGFASFEPSDWGGLFSNPKVLTSLVLWLVLLGVVAGKRFGWLHGRRHFYMILVGFLLVLATYIGLGIVQARSNTSIQAKSVQGGGPCSGL